MATKLFEKRSNRCQLKLNQEKPTIFLPIRPLRQICATDPKHFFKAFASEAARPSCRKSSIRSTNSVLTNRLISPLAISIIMVSRTGEFPMLVFTMPEPKYNDECLRVALILITKINSQAEVKAEFKCYTQELGLTEEGEQCFYFGEWQEEKYRRIGQLKGDGDLEGFAPHHQTAVDPVVCQGLKLGIRHSRVPVNRNLLQASFQLRPSGISPAG